MPVGKVVKGHFSKCHFAEYDDVVVVHGEMSLSIMALYELALVDAVETKIGLKSTSVLIPFFKTNV